MDVLPLLVGVRAATRTLVVSSAPRSTTEISSSVDLRTTLTGPLNEWPLTMTASPALTNSTASTRAPTLACQGKPNSDSMPRSPWPPGSLGR